MNGWNNSVDNNSGKTTGFSAAWTPNAKFSLVQNYLVGPEQTNDNGDFRHLSDTVVTYSPNAKLSFMANYDYGKDHVPSGSPLIASTSVHWSGIAGYIKYAPNDKWALATRGEYFSDNGGHPDGNAAEVERIHFHLAAHAGKQTHDPPGVPPRHVGPGRFSVPDRFAQGFAEHRDPWHGVRIQQRRCQVGRRQST